MLLVPLLAGFAAKYAYDLITGRRKGGCSWRVEVTVDRRPAELPVGLDPEVLGAVHSIEERLTAVR